MSLFSGKCETTRSGVRRLPERGFDTLCGAIYTANISQTLRNRPIRALSGFHAPHPFGAFDGRAFAPVFNGFRDPRCPVKTMPVRNCVADFFRKGRIFREKRRIGCGISIKNRDNNGLVRFLETSRSAHSFCISKVPSPISFPPRIVRTMSLRGSLTDGNAHHKACQATCKKRKTPTFEIGAFFSLPDAELQASGPIPDQGNEEVRVRVVER